MSQSKINAAIINEFFLTALVKAEISTHNQKTLTELADLVNEWEALNDNNPSDRLLNEVKAAVLKFCRWRRLNY